MWNYRCKLNQNSDVTPPKTGNNSSLHFVKYYLHNYYLEQCRSFLVTPTGKDTPAVGTFRRLKNQQLWGK
jgi:hypothetical protein